MRTAIVIPTCRPDCYAKWFAAWNPLIADDVHCDLFAVEDAAAATISGADSWREIDKALGDKAWIISREDSAIRSAGFYFAWLAGAEWIVTMDDDCFPLPDSECPVRAHTRAMLIPSFRSTLELRVRGLPYGRAPTLDQSAVNIGLWTGIPDFDGPTAIRMPGTYDIQAYSAVLPTGQYTPMCGMNLAFHRDAAPLMYFGLQGRRQPVARFDDIWCGVLAKRICDHLGWKWTFGSPIVRHDRASDAFANLIKEAPGIAEHETFWRYLAEIQLTETSAVGCMAEAAGQIGHYAPQYLPSTYFQSLAKAMETLVTLFDR